MSNWRRQRVGRGGLEGLCEACLQLFMFLQLFADLRPCLHKGRGLHTVHVLVPRSVLYATNTHASECVQNERVHLCEAPAHI